jgi:RND family efflux transporter MFP subunit
MKMTIHPKRALYLLTFITALITLNSCSSKAHLHPEPNSDAPIAVTVATPLSGGEASINISGQIEAAQSANISTRVMGYITTLKVKAGDHVNKGQLLATISNQDMVAKRAQADAMIAEAQAALKNAQKDFERFSALYKQQSATAKELDNVTLQLASAKSRLEAAMQMRNEASAQLNYTNLTAPFSGIVTQKLADAGSMANPGMPLLTIEQAGSYQVSASVPENTIDKIKLGQKAILSINAINKTLNGEITQVNQSSRFTGGQYIIKIGISDKDKKRLYAGMYVDVSIPLTKAVATNNNEDAQVLVPTASIENRDQLTGLYTISSNNTALLRWVRLGKTYGDKVEVLSGLDKHEQYIVSADGKLYNGAPVKLK